MNTPIQVVIPQTSGLDQQRNLLYISDLPTNITEEDLILFFTDYKTNIVVININPRGRMNEYTNQGTLTATVIFKDYQLADKARKDLNMRKIKGKTIRIMWHERDNAYRSNQANLFVKNIPYNIKPREVYEHFIQFGDIVSAKLNEDEDGNHLGYGYINYYTPESANKAINASNGKNIWGSTLEVSIFQKKNERIGSYYPTNCNVYVKEFPSTYSEDELKKLFSEYGNIVYCTKNNDSFGRVFAIVCFSDEESAYKAKASLHGKSIENNTLFVDILMNRNERKKIITHRIMDSNHKLNQQYKYCNLHIRNIPYNAKEEDLENAFKQFGPIKSVKIEKYLLVTKENNEFKEIPTSKGFGYVCFESPESANAAKEALNGKFLPKFETWNRPLLVELFMPKQERSENFKQVNTKPNNFNMQQMYQQMPIMQPPINYPINNMYHPQQNISSKKQSLSIPVKTQDDVDIKYLESLEDDYMKRDYLGELIFKKIENHKLSLLHNFTIDIIGKITGMILGIEDINEIIEICRNNNNLTSRIAEALDLLGFQR
jgi:polyadenylate-binding protein